MTLSLTVHLCPAHAAMNVEDNYKPCFCSPKPVCQVTGCFSTAGYVGEVVIGFQPEIVGTVGTS